jgi:multicomponent Na+:H+ antiporter subunit E
MSAPGWLFYAAIHMPVWIVFTGSFRPASLVLGLVLVLATFPVSRKVIDVPDRVDLGNFGSRALRSLHFVATVFIPSAIVAALDMSFRVVHPAIPIRPGILAVHVSVTDNVTFLILANHVTLTPGQLIVDIHSDRCIVYVHCIDVTNLEKVRREITAHFDRGERMLG